MDAVTRSKSATLTVIVHAVIFFILFYSLLKIQIPPFPETGGGGGVLVSIGTVDEAAGDIQPMSEAVTKPVAEQVIEKPVEEEKVATQDFEESPVTKEVKKEPKKIVKVTKAEVKTEPVKTEPVRTVNSSALYHKNTTSSTSQGTGKGKGDQGDPSGNPFAKYTGKNGTGAGGPGTGTGEGPGTGPGKGGVSFSLAGRRMLQTPYVNDHSQDAGRVVVEITVDKNGEVVKAIPGQRGSTTTSSYLFGLAKDAAMKAKFNTSDDAEIQKGTITFDFILQ
jgi:outer membrane biosynthesis protein TonB